MLKSALAFTLLAFLSVNEVAKADESNRNEVRASLSKDYQVVWGKNFTEGDWAQGASAIAGSVASGNPGPFMTWFSNELEQNLAKLQQNLPGVGADTLRSWIVQSLNSKKIIVYNGFKIQAGFATYQRWNRIVYHEPETYECRWEGPFGWTTGFCNRMVQKERRINLPNHNQFYVRFQLSGGGGGGNQNQPQESFNRVYVANKCSQPIYVASNYLNLDQQWTAQGFWLLQPGQSAYIVNTKNSIIEFNAVSRDGHLHWTGPAERQVLGQRFKFFQVNMTLRNFGRWTQNFTCSQSAPAQYRDPSTGDYEGNASGVESGELEPGQASGGNTGGGSGDGWDTPSSGGGGSSGDGWGGGNAAPAAGWESVPARYSSGNSDWNSAPDIAKPGEENANW